MTQDAPKARRESLNELGNSEQEAKRLEEALGRGHLRSTGMGLLSALSYTIHGMMDTDPESARQSGISETRETISQVATF